MITTVMIRDMMVIIKAIEMIGRDLPNLIAILERNSVVQESMTQRSQGHIVMMEVAPQIIILLIVVLVEEKKRRGDHNKVKSRKRRRALVSPVGIMVPKGNVRK